MRRELCYGNQLISYAVAENSELSSKIRIHVHPNGYVQVETPVARSEREVSAAVRKRARWIVRQLDSVAEARAHARPREYKSGETHFYLGRRYQLKVIEAKSEPSSVLVKGGQIRVTVRCTDPVAVRRNLNPWYQGRAENYFARRLREISSNIEWVRGEPPLKLVRMQKQWG